jgi:hypothetical protein
MEMVLGKGSNAAQHFQPEVIVEVRVDIFEHPLHARDSCFRPLTSPSPRRQSQSSSQPHASPDRHCFFAGQSLAVEYRQSILQPARPLPVWSRIGPAPGL